MQAATGATPVVVEIAVVAAAAAAADVAVGAINELHPFRNFYSKQSHCRSNYISGHFRKFQS